MADSIGILGTGNMGGGLARRLSARGIVVFLGSRDESRAQAFAEGVHADYPNAAISGHTYADAVNVSDIVVLTVPFSEGANVLMGLGNALAGKIVVDITNPFGAVPADTSGAQTHARLLPPGTPLVAAWKTNFWMLLDPQNPPDIVHDCFYCGDDAAAKQRLRPFIEATGFRPVDCGALANARVLDLMVPLMIELDGQSGGTWTTGWKFVS